MRPDNDVVLGACPSCGSTDRRRWLRHDALHLWLCDACGLGYSDPQPRAAVERRYLEEYDLAEHFGAHEARKRALNSRRLDRLPDPAAGQRLLDVGCGDGLFAAMAGERGWEPHGVELNPPAARAARDRGVAVVGGRVEDVAVPEASFDVVTAWDVIEHVPEPVAFIAALVRALAPGGTLVVTTLNRRSLVARCFRGNWSMVADEHFTYWDARSLRKAFEANRMNTIQTMHFGLGRDFVGWIDRLRGGPARLARTRRDPSRAPQPRDAASRWDSGPVALALEALLNRLLNATSLGVGVHIVLRAPSRPPGP